MGYVLHTPCPEIYCQRLIDEYCENYAEILCVLVYCIGMCLRQNSGQGEIKEAAMGSVARRGSNGQ